MGNIFGHNTFRGEKRDSRYSEVEAAWGRGRKQHWNKIWIVIVFFVIMAGSLWRFFYTHANTAEMVPDNRDSEGGELYNSGENIVTAAGVTGIGMDLVPFVIDYLEDTSLRVEKVYVSTGDTVAEGQKYIKFTDDSIDKARAELERTVQRAELAYRSKVISNGENSIQAKYTYDTAVLGAKFAQQNYQDTLTQLEMQVVKAENACHEAQEKYNAYYYAVENNTFYEDYQIEKLKKAYEDAYDLCTRRGEYWEVTEEELRMLSDSDKSVRAEQDDRQWIIRTVALLKEEALEAKAEYEQARRDYQREIEGAELNLQKLLNQLERAEQNLTEAQLEREKGSVRAKTLYELTAAKGQLAENDYNICLMGLADELEQCKDAKDEAVKNKELFETLIGDGYLYTERAGRIAMIQAEEGQLIEGGDILLAYENPKEVFVSAAVTNKDIAKISAGDRASVMISDCGSFGGCVEMISSSSSFDDITPVWKTVMVSLEGDLDTVKPNLAATVVFGEDAQYDAVRGNAAVREAVDPGTVSPMYDVNIFSETDDERVKFLEIAEMYVEAGQHIKKGDLVCRFTQDSIEDVTKRLTDAQSEAQTALLKAQTSYHIGVLEAGLSHNEAMINAALAQTAYDNTIAGLNNGMVAKSLEIEQLLADIYQMQLSLTDDGYVERQADITKAYDKAKKQVEKVKENFVTSQVEAAKAFQAAKESYEDFFGQFEISNQQIADKIEEIHTIQDEILQSQQLLEKALVSAEQTYKSSQVEGEIANAKYADDVKTYENAVGKAQSDLDQATQRLDNFNKFIGEGTLYAPEDGLVVRVGCKKGDFLADTKRLLSIVAGTDKTDSIEALWEEKGTQ